MSLGGLRRGAAAVALALTAGGGAAWAQSDPFAAALIEAAKQRANQAAADALARQSQPRPAAPPAQQPPPRAMPAPVQGGYDPFAAMRGGAPSAPPAAAYAPPAAGGAIPPGAGRPPSAPQYAQYPSFESFWPSLAYQPPSRFSQAPTTVPPGTPEWADKGVGPMTNQGKPAWTYSAYELKPTTWGDAMPARGSAGVPEYAKANINNTPVRQKWISTFDSWIRATYQPMGAVAIPFREIFPDKATQDHIPIRYGVSETLFEPIVKGGKLTRTPTPPFGWINVFANTLPGVEAAWPFNVPGQNFAFTLPFDRDLRLTVPQKDSKIANEVAAVKARIGIDTPVFLTSQLVVVLITRDGRLPARQMTIGEVLTIAEAGIRRQMIREPTSQVMHNRQLQGVAKMRAVHAGDLNAPASSRVSQFLHYVFDDGDEVFGRNENGGTYPIYTFDPAIYALAKTDTPQWMIVSFPRSAASNSWGEQMVYETMVNHFNFAYARDAIFNPQAVAGVAYAPRP